MRRRIFRLTREGKFFVLATIGIGIAAANTGNNLLFLMLGLMLGLILLSGLMCDVVLSRLHLERRLPQRMFAGSTALIEVVLRNRKPFFPSYSIEVEDVAEGEPTERRCYFLKVAPGSEQVAAYRRAPGRRGQLSFSGMRVTTRYPFGLIERGFVCALPEVAWVYPALDGSLDGAERHDVSGQDPAHRAGAGSEIAGVREAIIGDDIRDIQWQRSASLGRYVVKERMTEVARRVELRVDDRRPWDAGPDWDAAFERTLRAASRAAADGVRRGATVRAVSTGAASEWAAPGTAPDVVWLFLAQLEPTVEGPETEGLHDAV